MLDRVLETRVDTAERMRQGEGAGVVVCTLMANAAECLSGFLLRDAPYPNREARFRLLRLERLAPCRAQTCQL
jgi:hypothetical protein